MNHQVILVKLGEICLKGKNRHLFEKTLIENLDKALSDLNPRKITKTYGRIYIEVGNNFQEAALRIKNVFGVVSFSPALKTDLNMEAVKETSLFLVSNRQEPKSFKVNCRRPNKKFPVKSPDIAKEVGAYIKGNFPHWEVDLENPELSLDIEVRDEGVYIYCENYSGPGGLPVGTTGKGVLLLSGGIDSPTAAYLSMKRGIEVIAVHFYSYPFTSQRSREKVLDLSRVLAKYCSGLKLYINYFTEIQKEIRDKCPEEYYITLMRRMMVRIANKIAQQEGALALITGESLGQVASQTLESIQATDQTAKYPTLRPLVAMDKQEIVDLSQKIGTYDISIQPHEDCCTIFIPKHPSTRPKLDHIRSIEKDFDIEELIAESLENTEVITF